ncbi:sulfatase-like hydrolase/transferase [Flavobacterium saccharophilum]|uniref:Sulfatase n=1 Tax=Flavobacterium saccharophilum TaxID=29534 RepID=A0A1M7JJ25_9FLAO|nr:sulfatase-like hydrolase/transferase [Flavobacterium saccharophilum]SHM52968.1 Sulfatase [Flavobacterium saccharophilum]
MNIKALFTIFSTAIFMHVTAQQTNILWIVTDDQRPDALECYNLATRGEKESAFGYVSSPNINKLADEGVMFVNAYTNSPICGPL